MSSKIHLRYLIPGLLLVGLLPRFACGGAFDDLEVHGFATQGFVKSSANQFFGDSKKGSFDFRELGINATFEPAPDIRLSGQILSRRAGEISSGKPHVDFAVADLSLASSADSKINILIGRIKNPLGLYNDTREVAFTRPGIFLPQTVYFQSVRSLALSADGVALRASRFSSAGNFELQLGLGKPYVDENVEYAYLGSSFDGDFKSDGVSGIGRLMFSTPDERWRLAMSAAATSLVFRPKHMDQMTSGTTDILYIIASGQYLFKDWTITSEFVIGPTKYHGFEGTPFDGQEPMQEGGYAQVSWNVKSNVELMMRYEEGYIDRLDRDGSDFELAVGLPAHSRYTKAISFGVRWDPLPDVMLRAEYSQNNGTFILSKKENSDVFSTKRRWDMFAISASYRF